MFWSRDYYQLHIKDWETGAQNGRVTAPKSHSTDRAGIWTQSDTKVELHT